MTNVNEVLEERGTRYGKFKHHAEISWNIKIAMRGSPNWIGGKLTADKREALDMIAHKIARILNGDPEYADSWVDIAGYAQLVADDINLGDE